MPSLHRTVLLLLAGLSTTGCITRSIGPRTIPRARLDYNEAISRSWDVQLLLNIVRLRYRDNPLFTDVNSVTASYSFGRSASVGGGHDGDGWSASLGAGIGFEDNPVISYSYLSGEAFVQRILSPLAPSTLEQLAQSGWSIERLLLCCVHSINGIGNAIAAAGPTPDRVPTFERFQRVAVLFRRLQVSGNATAEQDETGRVFFYLDTAAGADGDSLRAMLQLDPSAQRFEVVSSPRRQQSTQIAVQGRSLMAVMFFLSHAVDVPAAHRVAGKVTVTRDTTGSEFDWARVVGRLMHVHSGSTEPTEAAVKVAVRDHWYWIDDSDLNSKTTFALLRLLLFLKSGERLAQPPIVTIPAR
jgi:hypothetical protein